MKFFLAILTIAIMAQASFAGSLGRVKRADEVEEAFEDMLKISRELVDFSVTVCSAMVEALPKTEEYATYRHDLEEFLHVANDLKTESGNCVVKTGIALKAMFSLFAKYDDNETETTEEYKALEELFEKFDGKKLEADAKEFQKKYYTESFLEKLKSYNEENVENWAFLKENC